MNTVNSFPKYLSKFLTYFFHLVRLATWISRVINHFESISITVKLGGRKNLDTTGGLNAKIKTVCLHGIKLRVPSYIGNLLPLFMVCWKMIRAAEGGSLKWWLTTLQSFGSGVKTLEIFDFKKVSNHCRLNTVNANF